jgi:DNA-binding PadR family transcriptional regulator
LVGYFWSYNNCSYFSLFWENLLKAFGKWLRSKKYQKPKKVYDTFYRLLKSGYIIAERKNHDLIIRLTEKGKRTAGWF